MEIAVIICAIIVVIMTITEIVVYWEVNKLLKEFKEITKELNNDRV